MHANTVCGKTLTKKMKSCVWPRKKISRCCEVDQKRKRNLIGKEVQGMMCLQRSEMNVLKKYQRSPTEMRLHGRLFLGVN